MTETPLENCPFCGGKALIGPTLDDMFVAMCEQDRCCRFDTYWRTKAEAIAAWNRRATPLPTTANNSETDAHGEMLAALKWIADNYENGMINHVDFRVGAKHRADAALTKAEVTHG